jgi:hypothetical protein
MKALVAAIGGAIFGGIFTGLTIKHMAEDAFDAIIEDLGNI